MSKTDEEANTSKAETFTITLNAQQSNISETSENRQKMSEGNKIPGASRTKLFSSLMKVFLFFVSKLSHFITNTFFHT